MQHDQSSPWWNGNSCPDAHDRSVMNYAQEVGCELSAVDILTGDRRWGQTSCRFYIALGLQPDKKSDKQDWTSIQEQCQRFASRPLLQSFDFLLRLWTQMTQIRFWARSQRAPAVTEHACNLPSAWGHCWGKTWCQMSWLLPTQWTASKSSKTSESWLDWSAILASVDWCTCTKPKCKNGICCQLASKNPFTQTHVDFCNETDLLQAGRWVVESCL